MEAVRHEAIELNSCYNLKAKKHERKEVKYDVTEKRKESTRDLSATGVAPLELRFFS